MKARTLLLNATALTLPLEDESVDMCVTSPPYFALRKYAGDQGMVWGGDPDCSHEWVTGEMPPTRQAQKGGSTDTKKRAALIAGEGKYVAGSFCAKCSAWFGDLGLEPTPELFIEHMVLVFREVRRVLKPHGTIWVNMGDSYAGQGSKRTIRDTARRDRAPAPRQVGYADYKAKDLMGMPWMLAFALRDDGWYLRSDIIWSKPNPMPESVHDRPAKSHEYIFLLSKEPRYFYDADAVREPLAPSSIQRISQPSFDSQEGGPKDPRNGGEGSRNRSARQALENLRDAHEIGQGRNRRTVWEIATRPYAGAHFATFPPDLVEPCVKAGTSAHGVCPECGKPWVREVEVSGGSIGYGSWTTHAGDDDIMEGIASKRKTEAGRLMGTGNPNQYKRETVGWERTCEHDLDPVPATVLDIFAGSGTSLAVARALGRRAVGVDISLPYLQNQARERLELKDNWWDGAREVDSNWEDLPLFRVEE